MKTKTKTLAFGIITSLGGLVAPGTVHAAATALALDPTSYNTSVVATATATPSGLGSFTFYDATFSALHPQGAGGTGVDPAGDFPVLTDTGLSGNVYAFAPNTGKDVILTGGTLTLAAPTSHLSTIYLLGTAANGSATGDVTLNFVGGATATSSVSFGDWGGDNGDINGLGRQSGGNQSAGLQFALFDPSISVPLADQTLALESVTYTATSNPNVAIFSVDGVVAAPEPSSYVLLGVGVAVLGLTMRRRMSSRI